MSIVAAYANREQLALKIKSVYAPVTPKPVDPLAQGARKNGSFTGDAPWALSALPECFSQLARTTGPPAYVQAHIPNDAIRVTPGTTITAADCRVFAHGSEVWVWRGADRMRIPPPARLYETSASTGSRKLLLLQGSQHGFELRIYSMVPSPQGSM